MAFFKIDFTKLRAEMDSLKEDSVKLKETINSIRRHLSAVFSILELGRGSDVEKIKNKFLSMDPSIDKYIYSLDDVTGYFDNFLSTIEEPEKPLIDSYSKWR